jgi:hypothetical protein
MRVNTAILLLAVAPVFAASVRMPPSSGTVVIYVEGEDTIPVPVRHRAETTVTMIFNRIGVPVVWQNGKPPLASPPDRVPLLIRFSGSQAAAYRQGPTSCTSPNALACSWPFEDEGVAVLVRYPQVRGLNPVSGQFEPLLAHTIAHEIAHALSVSNLHSSEGIMREEWTHDDYARMKTYTLDFTRDDVDRIHRGIEFRLRRQLAKSSQ